MAKFKEGDIVKLVREPSFDDWIGIGKVNIPFSIGSPLTISNCNSAWLTIKGHRSCFPINCFELYTDEAITPNTTDIVLKCTYNNGSNNTFTVNKEYKVKSVSGNQYTIKRNDGDYTSIPLKGSLWGFEIVIPTKELSKEDELLAYARKHYPIGTKFYPAHVNMSNKDYCIVTNNDYRYDNGDVEIITDDGKYFDHNPPSKYGTTALNRVLCHKGKWATIVSKPEEVKESKPQFIVGKWYKNIGVDRSYIAKFAGFNGDSFDSVNKEYIHSGKLKQDVSSIGVTSSYEHAIECSLEEIQQYLPDGHVDKIIKPSSWIPQIGEYAIMEAAGGWSYSAENDGCLAIIEKVGNSTDDRDHPISGKLINPKVNRYTSFTNIPITSNSYPGIVICRKATPSEISSVLNSLPKKEQSSSKEVITSKFNIGDEVSTDRGCGTVVGYTESDTVCVQGIKSGHSGNGVDVIDKQGNKVYLHGNNYLFFWNEELELISKSTSTGSTWIPKVGDWIFVITAQEGAYGANNKVGQVVDPSTSCRGLSHGPRVHINGHTWGIGTKYKVRKAEPHEIPIKPSILDVGLIQVPYEPWVDPSEIKTFAQIMSDATAPTESRTGIIPMQTPILTTKTKTRKRNLL